MSRPSSRTSSQRSSAWRSRGCVTAVPSCQNVPARSRRRPIARIFSINSSVNIWTALGQARDAILGQQLLFLQPGDLDLLRGSQRASALEQLELFVETTMFLGQLFQDTLLRVHGGVGH